MRAFERGEIYRVNLEPVVGSEQQGMVRPCVILSVSAFNHKLRTLGVVPLSSSPRALAPLVVPVPSAGSEKSMALCHQLRTIDKGRVGKKVGNLALQDLQAVEKGVRQVYGL